MEGSKKEVARYPDSKEESLCIHEAWTREVDKLNDLIGCMASGSMSRNNRGLLALQSGLCDAKASDQAFQNIC